MYVHLYSASPGDLTHATLTYRQVVWDYLHYPVPEAEDIVKHVAAAILDLELDSQLFERRMLLRIAIQGHRKGPKMAISSQV